ncbi:MAG: amidohydrolase family protein [Candidatus Methanofastidiosia archaeon]
MILKGGTVYSAGKFVCADIEITDGKITAIGGAIKGEGIDMSNYVIVPGIRNTHMHASSVLIRGAPCTGDLDEWVRSLLWRFEKTLSTKEAYYGSLYSMCQMVKAGITYFEDMHFHEQEVLRACTDVGIRASLSEAIMDMQEWDIPLATVKTSIGLARSAKNFPLVSVKMGIVSIRMASPQLIDECTHAVEENPELFKGYHVHLNEVAQDKTYALQTYGKSPAAAFDDFGVIGPGTTLAHCVHVGGQELDLIAKRGAMISHCLGSNLRLRSGIAPVNEMLDRGIGVSIGIDSPAINDGFDIMSDARFVGLFHGLEPSKVASMVFGTSGLCVGDNADMVMLQKSSFFPYKGMEALLAFGCNSGAVVHVIIDGRFVVRDKKITTVNEEKIENKALSMAENVWSRLELL